MRVGVASEEQRKTVAHVVVGACALGLAFGAVTSLVNGAASPTDRDGVATLVRITSLVLGAGWAWAALAIVAGWLAGTPARGAAAGLLALISATTVYYGLDSIVRQEPLAWYWPELVRWWIVSVVAGPALGGIGALARRPGVVGLLAGLAIPVGAAVQLVALPPGAGPLTATVAGIAAVGAAPESAR